MCADADVVIVCVFTDEQVRDVCLAEGLIAAMPAGSALVLHTTGSPRTVESIAEQAASRGVDVIDAPVSGGPHNAAAGALTLFVGGADDTVARPRPVLSCYGDPVSHIGLLAGAVELGARLGVTESALLSALPHGSAASRVLDIVAARGSVPRSSIPQASSSAKTSLGSGMSPPNSVVTSEFSTASSTSAWRVRNEAFRPAMNGLPLALQSRIPS